MENDRAEAVAALAELDEGRAAAARIRAPWWYYPATGVLLGVLAALVVTGPVLVRELWLIVVLGGLALLSQAYRFATGTAPGGFRSGGRQLIWGVCYAAVMLGVLAALLAVAWRRPGPVWLGVAAGVFMLLLTLGYGAGFERARRGP